MISWPRRQSSNQTQVDHRSTPKQEAPREHVAARAGIAAAVITALGAVAAVVVAEVLDDDTEKSAQLPGMVTTSPAASHAPTAAPEGGTSSPQPEEVPSTGPTTTQPMSLPLPPERSAFVVDFETGRVRPDAYLKSKDIIDLIYYRAADGSGRDKIYAIDGGIGYVESAHPTRAQCEAAARGGRLLPIQDSDELRNAMPFAGHKDLCIKTKEGNVVHLHLEKVSGGDGELKSYEFSVRLWTN